MSKTILAYDAANMRRERVGRRGVSAAEWKRIVPELQKAKRAILELDRKKEQGFLSLPEDSVMITECKRAAAETRKRFTDLVILGIGGSDLGARAIHQALGGSARQGMRLHFAGSSTDPNQLSGILKEINIKKTAVSVVSKTGGTLETMSAFLVFRDLLKKIVGKQFAKHLIATTDPAAGALRVIAEREGYRILSIPSNIPGRFSVLSACGLFPAAAMGANIEALASGARAVTRDFKSESSSANAPSRYAGLHVAGAKKRGQRIHVVMAYHSRMYELMRWVRQLIAENLGKKKNRQGKIVFEGMTPVAAQGPEDQHSQLQLYSEGPFDKLITMVGVKKMDAEVTIPFARDLPPAINRFGGRRMSSLLAIEREATTESLRQDGRPTGTLLLERLDEQSLGAFFMFYEIATAIMGELLDINAFNQPGVDLSKRIIAERLHARAH